ncbi:HNH endonuclease [Sphingomonas parapaucimobilis]|uniref:HNH endonuclease n=1 Tax=Sphingomonas parapaucimobilis TaxID=28213 RepID=UPI0009FD4B71|nr:HNH endonuclease signature motif containing protein [Sphingomonas parapaucimobilis]
MRRTNGLCERCQAAGLIVAAVVVDHIQPLALGGLDVDDNTRNLCQPCHHEVTAKQFGHAAPIGAKGIGRDGRPTNAGHQWNCQPAGRAPPILRRRMPTPPGGSKV